MSVASEVERLYTAVEESAAAVGVTCSRENVWPILDAYADAVPTAMIAFRVATNASHEGEFDCRISLPSDADPYGVALANGFLPETDHPIGSLVSDIRERFPIDSYGIDFGVVGGFKKVWVFFPEGDPQDLKRLIELPSMPPSVADNMGFFDRHGLTDRVGLIGIDYAGRTVNIYFGDLPAACHEPANIVAMHRDVGLPAPSEHMTRFCEQAFGIYTTMSWDSGRVGRIAFSVMTSDPLSLPVRLGAKIEQFVRSVSYDDDYPSMAHASVTSTGEEYYKLQSYYRWRPHRVNLRSWGDSAGTA